MNGQPQPAGAERGVLDALGVVLWAHLTALAGAREDAARTDAGPAVTGTCVHWPRDAPARVRAGAGIAGRHPRRPQGPAGG